MFGKKARQKKHLGFLFQIDLNYESMEEEQLLMGQQRKKRKVVD